MYSGFIVIILYFLRMDLLELIYLNVLVYLAFLTLTLILKLET